MASTFSGQTLNDRLLAARHSIAGQGLAKVVCKATTEEIQAPKRKHLDYLLRCTDEPNVSIPTLANLLLERLQNPSWVVVFKGLISIHHLMCYGNERFTQYLASSTSNFQLGNFLDKGGMHGHDMLPFVRRYAKYLAEKTTSYRTVAFDFCKVKRGKEGGTLRQMSGEKLLKTLPSVHDQVDALLNFEVSPSELNNGVINGAFLLLFRDLIRLFACYNDGIINLLEKYFEMNKKQARDALDIYKKFLLRMDRVGEFLKVAEKAGIKKEEIPDLAKAPSSLLEALEAHLVSLEGKKTGGGTTAVSATSGTSSGNRETVTGVKTSSYQVSVSAAVDILNSSFSSANKIDEKLTNKFLAEEEAALSAYKKNAKGGNPFATSSAEPFGSSSIDDNNGGLIEESKTPNILDLFGMTGTSGSDKSNSNQNQIGGEVTTSSRNPNNPFGPASSDVKNSNVSTGAAFFGEILKPQSSTNSNSSNQGSADPPSDVMNSMGPTSMTGSANVVESPKIVSGDLDASLANLTSNLSLSLNNNNNDNGGSSSNGPNQHKINGGFGPKKGPPMAQAMNCQNHFTPTF